MSALAQFPWLVMLDDEQSQAAPFTDTCHAMVSSGCEFSIYDAFLLGKQKVCGSECAAVKCGTMVNGAAVRAAARLRLKG